MSELQLNEPVQNYKAFPEKGTDRNTNQMPKLIAEGRTPLSASDLMKKRLEVRTASEDVKRSWLYNYFDTGDGVIYHPDGRAKVVLDAQPLRELTPSSQLKNDALILPSGSYEELEGQELSKDEMEKYASGDWLKQKEVRNNPIWRALARDENLLKDYSDFVFSQGNDRAMAVFRASPQDVPTMRSWYVLRLDDGSNADGWVGLDNGGGRFVGVAPEAQSAAQETSTVTRPTLDQVLAVSGKYVADVNRDNLREDLGSLYA